MRCCILKHPLFLEAAETNHLISKTGKAACEKDEELLPGFNCCAVCAAAAGEGSRTICPDCGKVVYCGEAHAQRDAPHHKAVCELLAAIAEADTVQMSHEEEAQHIATCMVASLQELEDADGWADVLPEQYTASTEDGEEQEEEGEEEEEAAGDDDDTQGEEDRPTKRARVAPAEAAAPTADSPSDAHADLQQQAPLKPDAATKAAAAAASPRAAAAATRSEIQAEAGDAAAAAPAADATAAAVDATAGTQLAGAEAVDPELQAAVAVAVASSYLSYAYTLGYALTSMQCVKQVVAGLPAGQPLVVLVLGAAEPAELQHMEVWKVLAGACPGGVVLQMVGPEVPLSRHMQVLQVAPGVQAAFYKGEYNALVDHVMVATTPLVHLPPSTSNNNTTTTQPTAAPAAAAPSGAGNSEGAAEAAGGSGVGSGPGSGGSALADVLRALPHLVVGFNQGLTCPDYDWQPTLKAMRRVFKAKSDAAAVAPAAPGSKPQAYYNVVLPWLQTANTQMEALMEEEVVRRAGWSVVEAPDRNPFTSLEPLQSGTLANDVYRKNAWLAVYQLRGHVPGKATAAKSRSSLGKKLGGWAKAIARVLTGGKRKRQ